MSPPTEMPCREFVERVTDYLEDAMAPDDRIRLEAHLGECLMCDEYLRQMRATLELTGRVEPLELGSEARRSLTEAFRRRHLDAAPGSEPPADPPPRKGPRRRRSRHGSESGGSSAGW